MGIENEKLELVKLSISGPPGEVIINSAEDGPIPLPQQYELLMDMAMRGVSPKQMALHGWASAHPFSFANLAEFLAFLVDKRLVRNPEAYEFAHAFRPNMSWNISLLSEPFFDTLLLRSEPKKRNEFLFWFSFALVLGLGILSLRAYLNIFWSVFVSHSIPLWTLGNNPSVLKMWFFGWILFSLGRSIAGLSTHFLSRWSSGEVRELHLHLDLSSLRLDAPGVVMSQKKSTAEGWGQAISLMLIFLPCFVARIFSWSLAFQLSSLFAASLALLLEFSPFCQSGCTRLIRYFYTLKINSIDAKPSAQLDLNFQRLYSVLTFAWFLLALMLLGASVIPFLRYGYSHFMRSGLLGFLAFIWLSLNVVLIAVAFVDDYLRSRQFNLQKDRLRLRQILRVDMSKKSEKGLARLEDFADRQKLDQLPFLRQMPMNVRQEILRNASLLEVEKGNAICKQGEKKRDLYILLSGRASVQKHRSARVQSKIMQLEAGSIFGETGFFLGKPRLADVVADQDCVVLEVHWGEDFRQLSEQRAAEMRDRIWFMQALAQSSFLQDLPEDALDALSRLGAPKSIPLRTAVVREGEMGDSCYFIIQGTAIASRQNRVLTQLKSGDVFGEIALLKKRAKRTATVIAETDLLTIELDGAKLWELMSQHLLLAVEIEKLALQRLKKDFDRNQG